MQPRKGPVNIPDISLDIASAEMQAFLPQGYMTCPMYENSKLRSHSVVCYVDVWNEK